MKRAALLVWKCFMFLSSKRGYVFLQKPGENQEILPLGETGSCSRLADGRCFAPLEAAALAELSAQVEAGADRSHKCLSTEAVAPGPAAARLLLSVRLLSCTADLSSKSCHRAPRETSIQQGTELNCAHQGKNVKYL